MMMDARRRIRVSILRSGVSNGKTSATWSRRMNDAAENLD